MHKKIHARLLTAEVVLIIASVFIFRSFWHLLDKNPFFNEVPILILGILIGFLFAIPAWRYIINQETHHH